MVQHSFCYSKIVVSCVDRLKPQPKGEQSIYFQLMAESANSGDCLTQADNKNPAAKTHCGVVVINLSVKGSQAGAKGSQGKFLAGPVVSSWMR
jgi:hypothetical protein